MSGLNFCALDNNSHPWTRYGVLPPVGRSVPGMTGVVEKNHKDEWRDNMVDISMRELLEAGVHFGHQTRRWNPKMKKYIFGARNGIYIIDLQQTVKMFKTAVDFISDITAEGKQVLFVGTKKQARESIYEEANRAETYYVQNRWWWDGSPISKPLRRILAAWSSSIPLKWMAALKTIPKKSG